MNNLEWYVMYWSWNNNRIQFENVIREDLITRVKKAINKNYDYVQIKEEIKRELMHHYWAKVECEMIVRDMGNYKEGTKEEKIDMWFQLEPNLDRICEYLIMNIAPIKGKKILKERGKRYED